MIRTETRNPNSTHIDKMSPAEMVAVMQQANREVADAVDLASPAIAEAIEAISERMKKGGRLFYMGCGTSGRLGVLDASECPPTYGVSPDLVVGIIAGGDVALRRSQEGVEDDAERGKNDIMQHNITELDTVMGISVAGNAAYITGALTYAKEQGALTVGLTCNSHCGVTRTAEINIVTDTGPEIVTGSTRMKAGTAHKMVLNMISTGVMIRMGRVYENYMIYIKPVNIKLKARMIRMTSELANCTPEQAEQLLEANNWTIDEALKNKSKTDRRASSSAVYF